MTSGYQKRDGTNGSTNLSRTGRASLPVWANRLQGRSTTLATNQYGPSVSNAYILGHYLEDYAYQGDLGLSHGVNFDLDEYNGRLCVTPEFPEGVWAYFTTISADGAPVFPYNIGRNFYGTPSGGNVNTIPANANLSFAGGPSTQHQLGEVSKNGGVVTLTWSSVEGGSYQLENSTDLETWTEEGSEVIANDTSNTTVSRAGNTARFYRLKRTGIAAYDQTGFDNQFEDGISDNNDVVPAGGGPDNFVATFTGPPLPPAQVIQELRIGNPGVPATLLSRDSSTQITISFDAAILGPGNHAVYVIFTTPNGNQLTLTSTNRFSP